jgi:hypothetical protein
MVGPSFLGEIMYHRVMTACLVLSLSACSNVEPIASSPVTLAAGSNEIKLQSPVTPHFRMQAVQLTLAGVVMEDRLDYPSRIHLLFEDGQTLTLSASVVHGDGTVLPLINPTSPCQRTMPGGCVIAFEARLPSRPVVAVRVNASRPATVNRIAWYDYSPK